MSYTAVRAGSNDTYTTKYYQPMIERLLSLLYIWCFATLTSCFAQKESISELYAQLDRAIEQSQHYTKLKESSIAQLKELIHQENNPKLLINTYRKIILNISPTRAILLWLIFRKPLYWLRRKDCRLKLLD